MPRSIQEVLDQADELARRFENYEPDANDERPVEEYMLERAALARARSERQVADAVIAARTSGASWQRIGSLLGTSAQAAQQRYGALIDTELIDHCPQPPYQLVLPSTERLLGLEESDPPRVHGGPVVYASRRSGGPEPG